MIVQRVPSVAYFPVKFMVSSSFLRFVGVSAAALVLANCASEPTRSRGPMSAQNQREIGAFSDKRKYGTASPRVVNYGSTVPKGGGRDHVGKPYRVAGRTYTPRDNPNYSAIGMSSWYGDAFHGRKTANGEIYDKHAYTAAHPTMPLPSYARVTNTSNGHSIILRVNDRGPFHGGRIIDVSERVANALQFKHIGTARVKVDYVQRASVAGSDDRKLVATLRTDGGSANLSGGPSPIMVAENTTVPGLAVTSIPAARPVPVLAPAPVTASPVVAQRETPVIDREETLPALTETRPVRRAIPLPPDRPFDLDSVPGAGTPIARVNNGQQTPVRTVPARAAQTGERVAAIYFAPSDGLKTSFNNQDPMLRLRSGAFNQKSQKTAVKVGPTEKQQVLRAGVFRDKSNAERLSSTLQKHGKAEISTISLNGVALYSVSAQGFANPEAARSALASALAAGAAGARLTVN